MDMKFQALPQQQQQESLAVANPNANPDPLTQSMAEAPPKQVAVALDRLGQAGRLIADIRLGADRLLEALFVAAQPHQSSKPLNLFIKEDAAMRQYLQDLRSIGRQLEETGVLNEPLRSRSNYWGLHMPLVCPDGAVVAYAWKRQLAGQAGASAVDRTRLALKAFTDQKKRFFPHLDDGLDGATTEPVSKKQCVSQVLPASKQEELSDCKTLSDVLTRLEKEVPNLKIFAYERLDWLKRASSLPSSANESPIELLKEHTFHSSSKLRPGLQSSVAADKISVDKIAVIEVYTRMQSLVLIGKVVLGGVVVHSHFCSYIHARGSSVYHVFRHITEHAVMALQYLLGIRTEATLYFLLHWICSYQTLFTKVCSKCGRLLAMDRRLALLLPPVNRTYRHFSPIITSSAEPISSTKDQSLDAPSAYHVGCFPEDG
ncbi:hypothetical protein JRO89_XS12G0124900 [Xanthoceras sorbifolium]|uniref:Mediator of RNA polymerase II transcription subunit 27 n=1 Tax=Xanthoceras sorbifolium TaxID=99658 RepID=A0ABQ8HCF0_9ROSI|nr:hypothetical protein JRO89_XS12G0124900 [Xanthoceras sorbifolium]